MHYKIERMQDYLRAELSDRRTAEESREFADALVAKAAEGGCSRVLICVRNSRPIFKLQPHGILEYFKRIGANPSNRVALISDSGEMRSSQQYIEMLGREQGANVRAFRDEAAALEWLRRGTAGSAAS
jgi:stage II sporulation SpoAA-like protein